MGRNELPGTCRGDRSSWEGAKWRTPPACSIICPHSRSTVLQQQYNRVGKVEHGSVALPAIMRSGASGPENFQVGSMPAAQQQITSGQMHRGHMPPLVSIPSSVCEHPHFQCVSTPHPQCGSIPHPQYGSIPCLHCGSVGAPPIISVGASLSSVWEHPWPHCVNTPILTVSTHVLSVVSTPFSVWEHPSPFVSTSVLSVVSTQSSM